MNATEAEWISAAAAMRLLASHGIRANGELLDRLRADMIPARAARIVLERSGRLGKRTETADNAEVPLWFWQKCTGPESSVRDWNAGSFSGNGYVNGSSIRAKLFGVEFEGSAVRGIVPADTAVSALAVPNTAQTPGSSAPQNRAGRKPDAVRWQAFWFCVVQLAKDGRLTRDSFESAAALSEEIQEMMGEGAFSSDHTKGVVGQIYKRFIG